MTSIAKFRSKAAFYLLLILGLFVSILAAWDEDLMTAELYHKTGTSLFGEGYTRTVFFLEQG